MRIIVDAMGTDDHPIADVAGAVMASREFEVAITLVGDKEQIQSELVQQNLTDTQIDIFHAPTSIRMDDKPNLVVRGKTDSSMHIGMQLVRDGKGDAFVTAGNTGAALAIAMITLKRIGGVKRPALTAVGEFMGHLLTVIDIGANTDTKLEWLKQFAVMANIYAESVLQITTPKVGLLANGEEDGKGDQLVRDANQAFRDLNLNFVGNVEPSDLFSGKADIVVTDGYVGNILLKTYETAMDSVFHLLREELTRDTRAKLGAALSKPYLKRVVQQLDPRQYGGAPLLGINGVVIITHGSATPSIMRNSIQQAIRAVESNVIQQIHTGLQDINDDKDLN